MKILVPVDGSAYSLKAVETACDLAKAKPPASVGRWPLDLPSDLEEGVYVAEKIKARLKSPWPRPRKRPRP